MFLLHCSAGYRDSSFYDKYVKMLTRIVII